MQRKRMRSLWIIPFSGVLLLSACSGAKNASDSEASSLGGSPAVSVVLYGIWGN
ncbi:hypothetical protein [Cohnella thailandensis]|uniref:Uncharacterized protein n=1 Tax=Cohnella thailandensis TaxID=557557 RepID=A0A841T188_9BACL|nr:hypothetical protein [Cohnella thailandensis]MBB6636325.1 hypothetical protein [Cohnella thailandensis]MBP1973705.1 ABC-type glycerol-3-phosphate transport system substrate-binding protein [Cohnella thailandensis]